VQSSSSSSIETGILTDSRDGKIYKTVKIGSQVWMAENLNYDPGRGGSGSNKYDWSWCYDDNKTNCDKYGRLYSWAAAMDSAGTWSTEGKGCGFLMEGTCSPTYPVTVRGICPSGWHLPTKTEFETLISAVGGKSIAGKMLKSISGWDSDGNGIDAYGFYALPAGRNYWASHIYREYQNSGYWAIFWSATEVDRTQAIEMSLYYSSEGAGQNSFNNNKRDGYSVRCVKN
jgi:uncharacterized protein (TIGR02145 family)